MRYVISNQDAFWFCCQAGPTRLATFRRSADRSLEDAASRARDLKGFDLSSLPYALTPPQRLLDEAKISASDLPRHVLVPEEADGHVARGYRLHRWHGELPEGALLEVGPDILVCSPEFCLFQLASTLSGAEFLRCVMALCARYVAGERKLEKREPVTTVERVRAFVEGCRGHRGYSKCRGLLRYARDNARSPKEIELHLLMTLPASMGGYGLSGDVLNYKVDLKGAVVDRPDRRNIEADLAWPERRVDMEYYGHEHDETIPQDRRRSNMITALRWFVVQVDSEQLSDPALLDITAREAARLLCRRVPEPTDTWLTQRGRLRETLLGAGHVHM